MCPIAFGIMSDGPQDIIPRDEWKKELEAVARDELKWDGDIVDAHILVELPFWLLLDGTSFSISFLETTTRARLHQEHAEISGEGMFLDSRAGLRWIGPAHELTSRPLTNPPQHPVYRPQKSMVDFEVRVLKEAIDIVTAPEPSLDAMANPEAKRSYIRRQNRAAQYFRSLASAHVPILNRLIASYRSASRDPFAFEVSEWDVPLWWVKYNSEMIRCGVLPYKDRDTYPTLVEFGTGNRTKIIVADANVIQQQLDAKPSPGQLEVLDAKSLLYRGRFGDAVRSAVTAIEVAIEHQLRANYRERGLNDAECTVRLEETKSSFHDRLIEYEQLSQKRLPGPLVSHWPHLNGLRLRRELDWVRSLRHKIVHEGHRVDFFSRGMTTRAIETMTWLFNWLSMSETYTGSDRKNDEIYSIGLGMPLLPFEYTPSGVIVHGLNTSAAPLAEDIISQQYFNTLEPEAPNSSYDSHANDLELFVAMTIHSCRLTVKDAPPEAPGDLLPRERFRVRIGRHKWLLFCLEFDGLPDAKTIGAVIGRLKNHNTNADELWRGICVIHHQCHSPSQSRELDKAIPDDVCRLAETYGLTLVTALDVRLLMNSAASCNWRRTDMLRLFGAPGRKGHTPPFHRKAGTVNRIYEKSGAISLDITSGESISVGDTLCVRLATRYHEQRITSLQVDREDKVSAVGPIRVGVATALSSGEIRAGSPVFVRGTPDNKTVESTES